jgi:holliday junction DNA helicase RuvA
MEGARMDLVRGADGWLRVDAQAQALPAAAQALASMRYQAQRIGEREVVVADTGTGQAVLGEKLPAEPLPAAWRARLGRYEVINADLGFPVTDLRLSLTDGKVCFGYRMPVLSPKRIQMPVRPLDDDNGVIVGLGRNRGDTLRFVAGAGDDAPLLRWSGFLARRVGAATASRRRLQRQRPWTTARRCNNQVHFATMIGRLHGQILAKHPPQVLIDVGGVGYEVEAPMSTFYDLPAVGEPVTLITHLLVREDAHVLYGFLQERDRALFRDLLKVTGVGAKLALAILSGMDAQRFALAVEQEDLTALSRLPGIGRKTAQRLVMEMKDRVAALGGGAGVLPARTPGATAAAADAPLADAVSALIALGYKPADANRMARAVDDGAKTSEEIIRTALRSVSAG